MISWDEITKMFSEDKKIFKMMSIVIALTEKDPLLGRSLRQFTLAENVSDTLSDLVIAKQMFDNPSLEEETLRIMLNLQSDEDFAAAVIKVLDDLLTNFKAK